MYLKQRAPVSRLGALLSQIPFTLVRFRFKTHNFCYGYVHKSTTPAFSRSKTETFENAAEPVLV